MSKPDLLYVEFGMRVRICREVASGMTQAELAKKVGLSRTSITNIEQGRQRVLLHDVINIAKALGVKPARLIPA